MGDTGDRLGYDMAFQSENTSMYNFHVADDHPLFRNAILEVIKRHYPDSVVGQSMDLDSAIRDLEKNDDTDLLLLDLFFELGLHRFEFGRRGLAAFLAQDDVPAEPGLDRRLAVSTVSQLYGSFGKLADHLIGLEPAQISAI